MDKFPTEIIRRIMSPRFNSAARATKNRQPLKPRGPIAAFAGKPLLDLSNPKPKIREAALPQLPTKQEK